jgi:hypothetical protein
MPYSLWTAATKKAVCRMSERRMQQNTSALTQRLLACSTPCFFTLKTQVKTCALVLRLDMISTGTFPPPQCGIAPLIRISTRLRSACSHAPFRDILRGLSLISSGMTVAVICYARMFEMPCFFTLKQVKTCVYALRRPSERPAVSFVSSGMTMANYILFNY